MNTARLSIPEALPIAAFAGELAALIRANQVIIVCGDTGSGKTTQLPKIALTAGRGRNGVIGCTQPRRLAAVAMARRVAEELQSPVGAFVGYQHRFEKKVSPSTRLKFMTDGILLAETRADRLFKAYDTLIIDEAHERSLNIDFLLGIIRQILPKRPDLRVIISSATLDAERFSAFYSNAPTVSIPGRLFPIETRWRPLEDEDDDDLPRRVGDAVDEIITEAQGDILVFLPGERDIRDTQALLEGRRHAATEIIPLLASLPPGEQQRAFRTGPDRRIILATNVAETSLTIPGIRFVIDSGLARLKRYNPRTHVQQLLIEPVSQASANQRKGRCGRLGPGVCIRLYGEDDFNKREPYTPPEIKRSALAGVILAMFDLRLGAIDAFPFIDPPSGAMIREGYRELLELGAIADQQTLTPVGRALAAFPLEPRYARILLAADRELNLRDALIVVAALSCDDPRRRPIAKQEEADKAHRPFLTPNSDFSSLLKLWAWYHDPAQPQSQTALRHRCKETYLSYANMREWRALHDQLRDIVTEHRLRPAESKGGEPGLHRALLTGLLSRIGKKDPETGDYRGIYAIHFNLFPGSGLVRLGEKKRNQETPRPRPGELPLSREWVMASELVETSRLFARTAACIDPAWIEPLAGHVCKYHRHSPFWDAEKGFVRIREHVTLFGLTLVEQRLRDYTRLDPADARRVFIEDALIAPGAFPNPPAFLIANQRRQQLRREEAAKRRHALPEVDDDALLFAFYDKRLPPDVSNTPALKRFLATGANLELADSDLPVDEALRRAYPATLTLGGQTFSLLYRHDASASDDGITCVTPPADLALLNGWRHDWLVPGALPDKLMWMLGVLPAKTRRLLAPLPETLSFCLARLTPGRLPLAEALFRLLADEKGIRVPEEQWEEDRVPPHLRVNFRVVDPNGKILGEGRNLALLQRLFAAEPQKAEPAAPLSETFALPDEIPAGQAGWKVVHYPALVDKGQSVALESFPDKAEAALQHHRGLLRLLALTLGKSFNALLQLPSLQQNIKTFLKEAAIDPALLAQGISERTLSETFLENLPAIRTAADFKARYAARKGLLPQTHTRWRTLVLAILADAARLEKEASTATGILPDTLTDILDQLAWLVFDDFVRLVPPAELQRYPLYLEAIRIRLDRARANPAGDLRKAAAVAPHWKRYLDFISQPRRPRHDALALSAYRWLLESLRVATFAQELKAPEPASTKRLDDLWQTILPKS